MGNTTSTSNKKSLEHVVNYLAAQYITKDEFKNMSNLNNPEYCNDVIILTSKIFKEYLNPKIIEYLAVKKGVEGENILTKDQIIAIQKGTLDKINVKSGLKRDRLCIGLAKFYIQIGHIFSAISSTLNPQYQFKDEEGNLTEQSITDRDGLPSSTERIITRNNLCSNRLKILLGSIDYSDILDGEIIKVNPNFCDSNGTTGDKSLEDEPGIPEFKQLYYDVYNYNNASFDGMSKEMEESYKKDVKFMYEQFSDGEKKYDSKEIENFSDIKLKDFYNASGCSSGKFDNAEVGSSKKGLFKIYADNIKLMVNNIKIQNDKLLQIIDKIFVFSIDNISGNKKVSINPTLNNEKLKNITKETRETIMQLYSGCETNFIEGLKIYEAIIRNQQFETTKSQLDNFKSEVSQKLPELKDDLNNITTNNDVNQITPESINTTNVSQPLDQVVNTQLTENTQPVFTQEQEGSQPVVTEQQQVSQPVVTQPVVTQQQQATKPQEDVLQNMLNTMKNTILPNTLNQDKINTINTNLSSNKSQDTLSDKIKTYNSQIQKQI